MPRTAFAIVCLWLSLPFAASPGAAQGIATGFIIDEIRRVTPPCAARPDAPVVGRVSGSFTGVPGRGASFEGCFYTFAECERWRLYASGRFRDRIVQNRCQARSIRENSQSTPAGVASN